MNQYNQIEGFDFFCGYFESQEEINDLIVYFNYDDRKY